MPLSAIHLADIVKRRPFPCPVADLTLDGKGLLVEVQSFSVLVLFVVHPANAIQRCRFACPVTNLQLDG